MVNRNSASLSPLRKTAKYAYNAAISPKRNVYESTGGIPHHADDRMKEKKGPVYVRNQEEYKQELAASMRPQSQGRASDRLR